jgi:hypothetical protein
MGSSASQGAVGPYMAIPPEEAGQADLGFPALAIGAEVDLLILNSAPQPIQQDVVKAPPPA